MHSNSTTLPSYIGKGERLTITKKRVESTSKGWGLVFKRKAKVRNRRQKVSQKDRNSEAGEIDKVKGGSMTQEEELKLGEVG